jgi:hypothetical protein
MPTFAHRKILIKALPTRFRTEEATVGLGLKNHPGRGGGWEGEGGMERVRRRKRICEWEEEKEEEGGRAGREEEEKEEECK